MLLSSGGDVVVVRGSVVEWGASEKTRRPMIEKSGYILREYQNSSIQIRCPRCLRNPVWRREKAAVYAARAIAAGISTLDISFYG
jgi:hypothetical protein